MMMMMRKKTTTKKNIKSTLCKKCTHDIYFHQTLRPLNTKELDYLRYLEKKMEKNKKMDIEEYFFMREWQKRGLTNRCCRWFSTSVSAPEDENGNPIEEWIFTNTETECGCLEFVPLELEPEPVPHKDLL